MCPMSLITQIKPQKNKKRFNVFIDEKFAFGLDAETLVKESLKENQEVSPERIKELVKENELQINLDKVFNFISYRPRSQKEISNFLNKKDLGEETKLAIIKKLEDLGMVDDLKFSQWWLEQRQTFRPEGRRLLSIELRNKGISKEVIEQVLGDQKEENEPETAKKLLEKKVGRWQNLSPLEFKKKASEFLLRRGFSWEVVKEAVANFLRKE